MALKDVLNIFHSFEISVLLDVWAQRVKAVIWIQKLVKLNKTSKWNLTTQQQIKLHPH